MISEIERIIIRALERDALCALILGAPEYCYLPNWTSASGSTDLAAIIPVMCDMRAKGSSDLNSRISKALRDLVDLYEGLVPVATILLIESLRSKKGDTILGIDVLEISTLLSKSILHYQGRLVGDKVGEGAQWPDRMLGELRRLSDNTVKFGGPSFVRI